MLLSPYGGARAPQIDKIWVIVPHSRPEQLPRLLENFSRQRFPGKRLIIVANGAAKQGERPSLVARFSGEVRWLTSREHPSFARNEALAEIRNHGGGFFTMMDDDDWYGPGYLDELAGYARDYEVVGKQCHFVSIGEGGLALPQLICCNRGYANQESGWIMGGTLSGWAEDVFDLPIVTGAGDLAWCARMRQRGARIRALSIYHYLYRRSYAGAHHVWKKSRQDFLRSMERYQALEFPTADDGSIDLEIVTGEAAPMHYRVVGQSRFIPVAQTHKT